ncbi:MAG: molybdopterin-dependent oxidoreductase, partial [Chloroflexota bacterium]|nr:molybdopterin-dependent oxidoreductase [Chloroflexota bacterium]
YGSPNLISTDSLDVEAARLAMFLAQGINGYPVYDIDNARYVITFGGSLLESSRYLQKYLSGYGFMHRGQSNRGKLVVVDSRLSVTAAKADEWVPIRPGTLGALALGIAHVLIKSGAVNRSFVDNWCFGYEDFVDDQGRTHLGFKRLVLEQYTLERVADITGIPGGTIARLAGEFGANHPALAIMPTGRGDLSAGNGLATALAIHALNALVGSVEVPGGVQVQHFADFIPWPPLPADPVAEKGRQAPRLDGAGTDYPLALSACQALGDALAGGRPYAANVLFLLNANPVHELPQGQRFAEALQKVPLVVSFSPVLDETAAHADLILPALTFLEVWQDDILEGTGYPGIALRQPVVQPVRDGRNPGDVLLQLARAVGGPVAQALPWGSFLDVIKQRIGGMGISWDDLVDKGAWSGLVYFFAAPGSKAWGQVVGRDRLYAPKDGRYDLFARELFALRNLNLEPGTWNLELGLPHFELPTETASADYPFLLISQETMTHSRNWSGIIPTLQETYGLQVDMRWDSWMEIPIKAAHSLGIGNGDWVWVESAAGKVRVRARLVEGLWPNAVNVPPGQGHFSVVQWGREENTARRIIGANPYQVLAGGTEKGSGLAAMLPTRV